MLRRFSSWITNAEKGKPTSSLDVESLFLDKRVQELLHRLVGFSPSKVFHFRQYAGKKERPRYRLMTQEEFDGLQQSVAERAKERLQIPPFKKSRSDEVQIISHDPEIAGGDNAKMIFYDISPGLKSTDRLAVVREVDGSLRTATGSERDRMYRTYFPSPHRPVIEPAIFEDPALSDALNSGKHEFVLDYACWFFEPDDPKYITVTTTVFDHLDKSNRHETLWSTRHFGSTVFYLVLNKRIDNLLISLLNNRRLTECANVIRLYRICHSDCKTKDAQSDIELVKNFIKFDSNNRPLLENVLQAYEEDIQSSETRKSDMQKS